MWTAHAHGLCLRYYVPFCRRLLYRASSLLYRPLDLSALNAPVLKAHVCPFWWCCGAQVNSLSMAASVPTEHTSMVYFQTRNSLFQDFQRHRVQVHCLS